MNNIKLLFLLFLVSSGKLIAQGDYFTLGSTNNGCNDKVYAITGVQPQTSVIYVGGNFTNAGGAPAKYVAKWDQNAFAWTAMQPHGGMNGAVRSLTYMNGTLYAAGDFIISDSTDTWHVAKWTGSQWTNLGGGLRGAGIWALTSYNNELYAGGYIDTLGFNQGLGIEKWNGSSWVTLGGYGYGVSGANGFHVEALQAYNGELYVGGLFSKAGNGSITANNIAKWNGTTWSALGTGANGEVKCFTVLGSDLYIGGDFTSVNGVPANRIAKYNGSVWSAVGAGFDTTVFGLNIYRNKVYATGNFLKSGTDSVLHIARWNGSSWERVWNGLGIPGINFTGYCLTPNDSSLYVGGYFTVAGTQAAIDIARIYVVPVGIEELSADNSASVYPNPSDGNVTFQWKKDNLKRLLIEIYSVDGKLVATKTEKNLLEKSTTVNLTNLPEGFYLMKITADNVVSEGKLIISR